MAKRRMSKQSKRRLTIFGTLSLIIIVYFCFSFIYNAYTIYDLYRQKNNLENLYSQLQEEAETLKIDIEKLNDDNYLANYAREHYLYSKDGEYIIQLSEDDIKNVKNNVDDEINKNYIILGLSAFMFLIFIYIIFKSRKK